MKKVSENGQIFICSSCKKIHVEFGNIGIDFKGPEKLTELQKYLKTVRDNHFENEVLNKNDRRQLLIPFSNSSFKLLLSNKEIIELIDLIADFLNQLPETKPFNTFANLKSISSFNTITLN